MEKPENPHVFPQAEKCGDIAVAYGGMTLRDYFAIYSGITFEDAIKVQPDGKESFGDVFERLAKMRFAYADFMLKERMKNG